MLLMTYMRSILYSSSIWSSNRWRSSGERLACSDVSSRRRIDRLEYHFIFKTIWIIPSLLTFDSLGGFENIYETVSEFRAAKLTCRATQTPVQARAAMGTGCRALPIASLTERTILIAMPMFFATFAI